MTPTVAIADELLTESQVVARVPGREADVRAWLRGLGIARRGPTGVKCYRWAEVLARVPLADEPPPAPPPTKARGGTLPRASLR